MPIRGVLITKSADGLCLFFVVEVISRFEANPYGRALDREMSRIGLSLLYSMSPGSTTSTCFMWSALMNSIGYCLRSLMRPLSALSIRIFEMFSFSNLSLPLEAAIRSSGMREIISVILIFDASGSFDTS